MQSTRISIATAALACGLGWGAAAHAQGAGEMSARSLAANCAACHGTQGRAQGEGLRLAGLDKRYLVAQMQAFKSGQRPSTVMQQLAKGYDDAAIEALATYFAQQR